MYAPSKLARYFSQEGDLFGLPLRATFSPAHPLARRDVHEPEQGESATARCASTEDHQPSSPLLFCEQEGHLLLPIPVFLLFPTSPLLEGGLVDPRLRASNEHIPIVRVPRAREDNRHPHFIPPLPIPPGESPDCPSLRASNEGLLRPRVARARRMVWRLPSHSSFDSPPSSHL
jgi:hypothetical protein